MNISIDYQLCFNQDLVTRVNNVDCLSENLFLSDPEYLDPVRPEYLSHEERYANELRKACYMVYKFNEDEEIQQLVGQMEGIR